MKRLIHEHPEFDAKLFIEEEDPLLRGYADNTNTTSEERLGIELGPNPKIRNMSRAYREAKGDIVWIIDCNVWVGRGVCGRMVDLLCGFGGHQKNKFVHQLPLVVDMDGEGVTEADRKRLLSGEQELDGDVVPASPRRKEYSKLRRIWQRGGGRLEEMFMSSSHAKFYTAINTVLVAPCIVGKSNMFRRSHLEPLTASNPNRSPGIDFFSDNICEDHLIGDALWKKPQPFELPGYKVDTTVATQGTTCMANGSISNKAQKPEKFGKHALLFGDMCIQPVSHTSVPAYIARRVRWLRVRKFTVTLATLVEPGTESVLCSLYGAYGVSTLPFFSQKFGISPTWTTFWACWFCSVAVWSLVDWTQYRLLHSGKSLEIDLDTPDFVLPPRAEVTPPSRQPLLAKARPADSFGTRRTFFQWWFAWLGREFLAFPIWFWAVWGGTTVSWRGRKFWVGMDMKVHEISTPGTLSSPKKRPMTTQ